MNIDGSWWALIGAEKFDRNTTARIEARGGVLTWSDGIAGSTVMHEGALWLKRTLPGATLAEDVHERYQILKSLDDGDVLGGRLYRPVGDLSAYHENGLRADLTPFTLVRDGSLTLKLIDAAAMAPTETPAAVEQSIAELDAPGALLAGNWVMLVEDEPIDLGSNEVLDLDELTAKRVGSKIMIRLSAQRIVMLDRVSIDRSSISGLIYQSSEPMPEGDPAALWDALDGAPDDDERYDKLPVCDPVALFSEERAAEMRAIPRSRYSTIDVSMYSIERQRAAGIFGSESDDQTASALAQLPSAKVTLTGAYPVVEV